MAPKSLIKRRDETTLHQDIIKTHNKRVKFSETMQVFCYELPDNQMPQIIALKSPAEMNLMEFQSYMFEPPAEYQDFLTFEPPPDYRDFIANSLNVFRNEVTFDYIDEGSDSDSANGPSPIKNSEKKTNHISSLVITNDSGQNSKWQSMIIDNNLDSLEEEQIIGVLKEDDILQAIGSQITLPVSTDPNGPSMNGSDETQSDSKASYTFEVLDGHYEENLSSEDFPVHHLNSYLLNTNDEDDDACCVDSSPNGSLQDLASDSSITSQDTIILINQNKSYHIEANGSLPNMANNKHSPMLIDNIYENVQNRTNGDSSDGTSTMQHDTSTMDSRSTQEKQSDNENGLLLDEVLYENMNELLSKTNGNGTLAIGHSSNLDSSNRHSMSSSDDGNKSDEGGNNIDDTAGKMGSQQQQQQQQPPPTSNNKFKQNLMFYENMMIHGSGNSCNQQSTQPQHQLQQSVPPNVNISKHVPMGENVRSGSNLVPHGKVTISVGGGGGGGFGGSNQSDGNNNINNSSGNTTITTTSTATTSTINNHFAIPVRLPSALYTIVDPNRASSSSSSSLSSISSSSSSSILPGTSSSSLQSVQSSLYTNVPSSASIQPQVSPNLSNSSSNSSSSSAASSVMHPPDYLSQFGQKIRPFITGSNVTMATGNVATSGAAASVFAVPSLLNDQQQHIGASFDSSTLMQQQQNVQHSQQQQQQQHGPSSAAAGQPGGPSPSICVLNHSGNTGNCTNGGIRTGQVVYRYPYALIQQQANGVSTIRPVQYIVQTNAQTGVQSVLYNPRLVINNQPYSLSPASSNGVNVTSSNVNPSGTSPTGPSGATSQTTGTGPIGHNNNNNSNNNSANDSQPPPPSVSIPVRRILLPQGATMLAPRIMHLHPQHHKQAPPPYQYYVQQRQQQAILAYQQNVHLYPGTSAQVQMPGNGNQSHGHTEFPNPSEIRRRDGLYAYPQILLKNENEKTGITSHGIGKDGGGVGPDVADERDELEEFVQQEQQRTDRIKKRYSFTEDDDPTFGFARRPSVRGIRPKFGTTNEIIQQMTSTMPIKPSSMQPKMVVASAGTAGHQSGSPVFVDKSTFAAYGTLPKGAQFINLSNAGGPVNVQSRQMISIVKQIGDLQLNENNGPPTNTIPIHFKSQTLPRQMNRTDNSATCETVRIVDANGMNTNLTLSREQLKLQIQKQLERQMQHQQQQQQQQQHQQSTTKAGLQVRISGAPVNVNSGVQRTLAPDERGVPEGASYSPNHPGTGGESASFTTTIATGKDTKPNLVNEGNKPNGPDMAYYSLNV